MSGKLIENEHEAIEALKLINLSRVHPFYTWEEMLEVRDMAIQALKEAQQYRALGTLEECRAAVEKQKPNKPKDGLYGHGYFACGSCKNPLDGDESYCPHCGQAIQWGENLEGDGR